MKSSSELPIRCVVLKELRKSRKMTQQEVASEIDVTDKTYRSWENGEYKENKLTFPKPDLDSVIKLAELYNCSIDYLLGRSKCTSIENDYIEKYTGLCNDSIEILHELNNSDEGFVYIPIINYLVGNEEFSKSLIKKINEYYCKYEKMREADSTYSKERKEIRKKTGNVPVIFQNNVTSSELQVSVTRQDLTQYIDIAEAKRFQIQKEFDDILIELVKYHYNINHPIETK